MRFFFSHDVDSTGPPSLPTVTESLTELLPTSLQSRMKGKVHVVHNHRADLTFCRPSQILPIYRIIARGLSQRRDVYVCMISLVFICRENPRRSGIYFLPTITDFADISDNHQKSVPDSRETPCLSFVGNNRQPSQKSGTTRENRNAPDSSVLFPSIPDDRRYLRFRVFIKPCFHMSGKSQTIGDFDVSRVSQILPTNKNSKRRKERGVSNHSGR